jgi:hypothetical protein
VYDKLSEFCTAFVAIATVPHQQLCQVTKLHNGEIGRKTCLPSFLTDNSNTNVCGLYHRDIVPTVANAADAFLCVSSD